MTAAKSIFGLIFGVFLPGLAFYALVGWGLMGCGRQAKNKLAYVKTHNCAAVHYSGTMKFNALSGKVERDLGPYTWYRCTDPDLNIYIEDEEIK